MSRCCVLLSTQKKITKRDDEDDNDVDEDGNGDDKDFDDALFNNFYKRQWKCWRSFGGYEEKQAHFY